MISLLSVYDSRPASRFWALGIQTCTVTARKHFEEAFTDYVISVYDQALNRATKSIHTVETYFKARRENIGIRPSYIPAVLGIDIADEAFYHPMVVELAYLIAVLVVLDNVSAPHPESMAQLEAHDDNQDIYSYNKEQATGDDQYNIITIVMNQYGYTLDEAMKWTANCHEEVEARFMKGMKELPYFGPEVDPQLQQFIQALALWPRANDCWSFESGRYFGSRGLEIQKTRTVPTMPKVVDNRQSLRRENVVIPLID